VQHTKSAHDPHAGFAEVVLLDRNTEPFSHKFKLLVKFFGLHNLFVHTELILGRLQRHVLDRGVLSIRKGVMNGLDYNLSHVFNQDVQAGSW